MRPRPPRPASPSRYDVGTTSIEDVARAAPAERNWFQLSMWRDRDRSMALVHPAPEKPVSIRCWSRSMCPWQGRGCAMRATA